MQFNMAATPTKNEKKNYVFINFYTFSFHVVLDPLTLIENVNGSYLYPYACSFLFKIRRLKRISAENYYIVTS